MYTFILIHSELIDIVSYSSINLYRYRLTSIHLWISISTDLFYRYVYRCSSKEESLDLEMYRVEQQYEPLPRCVLMLM